MEDTLKELLQDFVLLAATIDYGIKLVKWLKKKIKDLKKFKSPHVRRLK